MESNDRLVMRLPSDLKAMFTALCESENVTVAAKLKNMMVDEIKKKADRFVFHQKQLEMMPTSLKKEVNAINQSPIVEKDTIQSAINAKNKRKIKQKKR